MKIVVSAVVFVTSTAGLPWELLSRKGSVPGEGVGPGVGVGTIGVGVGLGVGTGVGVSVGVGVGVGEGDDRLLLVYAETKFAMSTEPHPVA